jgi:PKD repeat protein
MTDPLLRFDYAHAQYNASFEDGLRVEAFPGCDLGATPVVLWEKFDPELATITTTSNWAPQEASQWRSEVIDLKPYAGQSMVLRFTAINGYSNNTFLDNVNIANVPQIAPVADFSVADTLCRLDTIAFAATPSPGPDHTYTWVFGGGATPSTANGPGPHSVVYTFAGNRTVQLLVANGFTTDTALQTVHIRAFPTSNFTQVADGLTVSFTNTSQNATEYLWNFGDNTTSTEKDPVHTYAAAGTYSVQLSSINPCRTINKTVNLTLTTGTIEQTGLSAAKILPNPNKGRFSLSMEHQGAEMEVQLRLVDASGRVVAERNGLRLPSGATVIPMEISEPVAGAYQLWIQTAKGSAALPVVVME